MEEGRRRAYLQAMQVDTWLPRVALPLAAPSRPEVVEPVMALCQEVTFPIAMAPPLADVTGLQHARKALTIHQVAPPLVAAAVAAPSVDVDVDVDVDVTAPEAELCFSLQLLRAGNCLLLLDTLEKAAPTFTLLLRDLLQAAGLPVMAEPFGDGEPLSWPLLHSSSMWPQDMAAAQDYVQEVILVATEQQKAHCLWLFGALPRALMQLSAAETDSEKPRWAQVESVNLPALCLPSLDFLMSHPSGKPKVWQEILVRRSCWASEEKPI